MASDFTSDYETKFKLFVKLLRLKYYNRCFRHSRLFMSNQRACVQVHKCICTNSMPRSSVFIVNGNLLIK